VQKIKFLGQSFQNVEPEQTDRQTRLNVLLFTTRHSRTVSRSMCPVNNSARWSCLWLESSRPVRCPFYGAFRFRYDDLLSGFCDGTVSYAQPCVGHSRYQLSFNHCVDSAAFNRHSMCHIIEYWIIPKRKHRFPWHRISWAGDWVIEWLTDWVRDFSSWASSAMEAAKDTKFDVKVA